jgi:hypothetical protein
MKNLFNEKNRKRTRFFLFLGLILLSAGLITGINDNPPGIALLYLGVLSLLMMFIHPLRGHKPYVKLFAYSIAGFILFAFLHNALYGVNKMIGEIMVLNQVLEFLHVTCFLMAVIICPPGILIGFIGLLYWIIRERIRPAEG